MTSISLPPSSVPQPATSTTAASISRPPATTTQSVPASKPPITISPTAWADPTTSVTGTHPVTIASNVVTHQHVRLISSHCPLAIGEGCIIAERCVLGAPNVSDAEQIKPTLVHAETVAVQADNEDREGNEAKGEQTTTLGTKVHLYPSVSIHHSVTISSYTIIESYAQILPGVRIGEHSKICAGAIVDRDVGDWEVVWGGNAGTIGSGAATSRGLQRRKRNREMEEAVENVRLKGMEIERLGTVPLLKAEARVKVEQAKRTSGGKRPGK